MKTAGISSRAQLITIYINGFDERAECIVAIFIDSANIFKKNKHILMSLQKDVKLSDFI